MSSRVELSRVESSRVESSRVESSRIESSRVESRLEDYQRILEEEYRGWYNVLRSAGKEIPEDENQGSVQGGLVRETSERLNEIALELDKVAKKNQIRDRERCELAALSLVEESPGAGAVLHTHTVGLAEVRRDLAMWREALQQEYDSLTKITGAVKPIDKSQLVGRTDLEFAPGKLVATVKAPSGRKKARIVVCGSKSSRVESSRIVSSRVESSRVSQVE